MIRIENLVHQYTVWESETEKSKKTVLDGISFDIPSGQFLAILGPNGCGKTSLGRTIVKLYKLLDDGTEEELMSAKTGKDGMYAFSVPENGQYVLSYSLPNDYRFTMHGKDSVALPARGTETAPNTYQCSFMRGD